MRVQADNIHIRASYGLSRYSLSFWDSVSELAATPSIMRLALRISLYGEFHALEEAGTEIFFHVVSDWLLVAFAWSSLRY